MDKQDGQDFSEGSTPRRQGHKEGGAAGEAVFFSCRRRPGSPLHGPRPNSRTDRGQSIPAIGLESDAMHCIYKMWGHLRQGNSPLALKCPPKNACQMPGMGHRRMSGWDNKIT